jgi:hypothetical protein
MKPVTRFQSQLLYRRSYKPGRPIRIRPVSLTGLTFRPSRAGPVTKTPEGKKP